MPGRRTRPGDRRHGGRGDLPVGRRGPRRPTGDRALHRRHAALGGLGAGGRRGADVLAASGMGTGHVGTPGSGEGTGRPAVLLFFGNWCSVVPHGHSAARRSGARPAGGARAALEDRRDRGRQLRQPGCGELLRAHERHELSGRAGLGGPGDQRALRLHRRPRDGLHSRQRDHLGHQVRAALPVAVRGARAGSWSPSR